jgi:signal transduction histidine kinase
LKRTGFYIILTGILLLCAAVFFTLSLPDHWVSTRATEGIVDLRDEDFDQNLYTLGGEWEFYYGKLLTPADFDEGFDAGGEYSTDAGVSDTQLFAAGSSEETEYLTVPSDWALHGYPLYGCGTYRLRLLTHERQLTLLVPEIPDASVIYVNGKIVFTAGTVSDNPEGFSASVRNAFVTFDTMAGEAEVIIQVANYQWGESGLRYDLLIGRPSVMLTDGILRRMVLAAFIGAILFMGFYHGALFVASRREKIFAIFALMCILQGLRFFLETNGFAQMLLPNGLSSGLTKVYLLSMPIGTSLSVWFTYLAFDIKKIGGIKGILLKVFFIGDIFLCILIALMGLNLYVLAILMLLPLMMVFILATKSGQAKDKPYMTLYLVAIVLFCVWGILTKIIWGDLLYMPGIASNLFLMLSQCVLLALEYGRNRRQTEELAAQNRFLDNLSRMKTEYLTNLTHEMKTPLTVVSLHIQRALRNLPIGADANNQKVRESLTAAKEETMKVASMAQTALDSAFSGESKNNMEILNIGELLRHSEQTFRPIALKRGNALILDIPTDLPQVLGDGVLLARGVMNLLSNAAAATENGTITIRAAKNQEYITITIDDDGAPIPEEIVGREFIRGVSGSGGTGLGLTITRGIIEAHGGTISLYNREEGGVAAEFTLPVYRRKGE